MSKSQPTVGATVQFLMVDENGSGQRIDNFLFRHYRKVPKSRIYRMIRNGEVRVNKGRIRPTYRVQPGDRIRVPPIRMLVDGSGSLPVPMMERDEIPVLAEEAGFLVIDKPSGLAVHGGSGLSYGLIERLRRARPDQEMELAHRLDRETSGCLVIALRRSFLRHFHSQLRDGKVRKVYTALLRGELPERRMVIDAPLRKRIRGDERVIDVSMDGKPSRTILKVRRIVNGYSLADIQIPTGRTHQIRVHTAHIGHPVVGDEKYGDREVNRHSRGLGLNRLFLHASMIGFEIPEIGFRQFEAELPASLSRFADKVFHHEV